MAGPASMLTVAALVLALGGCVAVQRRPAAAAWETVVEAPGYIVRLFDTYAVVEPDGLTPPPGTDAAGAMAAVAATVSGCRIRDSVFVDHLMLAAELDCGDRPAGVRQVRHAPTPPPAPKVATAAAPVASPAAPECRPAPSPEVATVPLITDILMSEVWRNRLGQLPVEREELH